MPQYAGWIPDIGDDQVPWLKGRWAWCFKAVATTETDVSRIDALSRLEAAVRERFGGTDILMNNAGIQPGSTLFGPAENWRRLLSAHLLIPGYVFTELTAHGATEKPAAAWTPEQTVDFMMERLEQEDFYILCPDNDVPRSLDERRIAWAAGDIIQNRPPLSRWHPDWKDAFAAFVNDKG